MRISLIIAILFWDTVAKTASSSTPSTIQGPSQGISTTSALYDEDCLSTVDWHDIVFISAVPIAAGFGLLMLLAFLRDLRQAYKSTRSCLDTPPTIEGNRARKECTYVIGVDYAGRSHWGSFLRWCAKHKSSGARKNPRLVRLRGTIGYSDWLSFHLVLGEKSEQKIITKSCSIGKLVAVETKYPSASDGIDSMRVRSYNITPWIRGLINRACDIEIKNIHVTDTKTQDQFISDCGTSNGGISSSDLGITTILPLLPFVTKPEPRVNYIAYFITIASLLISTFAPWRKGNFTAARHVTCLFVCITSTMYAVQVVSMPLLDPFLDKYIVMRFNDVNITMGLVIRTLVISVMVYPFLILVEIMCRQVPTVWSMFEPCMLPHVQHRSESADDSQLGVSSSQDTTQREILPDLDGDGANKNNNKNDVTIIEMEPFDDPPTSMQISADDFVSVATRQSSTAVKPNSSSCVTIIMGEDSATTNQNGTTTEQDTPENEATVSKEHHSGYFGPIAALVSHILLIALCMLSLLGSVSSVHGLCWNAFWEWVATSIIAVLNQVIVLDIMKAVGMTVMKACASDKAATPRPYSIIN